MDISTFIQFALLIPLGLLAQWIRALSGRIDKMMRDYYTKQETKEMIALTLEPVKVALHNVQEDITEIKSMLITLVNERK